MLNSFRPLARNRDFLVSTAGRCASRFGDEAAIVALTLRLQSSGAQPYLVGQLYADSGAAVKILYAGAAPGLIAGVAQINFVAPDSSSVVLTTGKYASAPFPIYVLR